MKPAFPEVAPVITAPSVKAELICDMDEYSNGTLYMGLTSMTVNDQNGKKIGSLDTDVCGRWFVSFGSAHYAIDTEALFCALYDAHLERVTAPTAA